MSESWTCLACGPRRPEDLAPVAFKAAYFYTLGDWRVWAFAVAVTVAIGMTAGALGLGTAAVGAGGGGTTAMFMMARVAKVRRCKKCSLLLRG